jgi:spore maturation protein CgeB
MPEAARWRAGCRCPMLAPVRIAFFAKSKRRTGTSRMIHAALRRAGSDVLWVNERRLRRLLGGERARGRALRAVRRFEPDFVLVHASDASPQTLLELAAEHRCVLFTPDCWDSPLRGERLANARRVDLVLTVAKGQVPELLAAGVRRAAWLPEACDPTVHHPVMRAGVAWRSQVAYIGKRHADSPRYAARAELVRAVCERFETRLYGEGWEAIGHPPARRSVGVAAYRRICAGADVVLGRDWTDACEGYFSNRTWFTLGCGGFLVTNHVPGLEAIFENHRHLVWYASEAECLDLIAHYLAHPDERRRIAAAGREYAHSHRTYDHFARELLAHAAALPARVSG